MTHVLETHKHQVEHSADASLHGHRRLLIPLAPRYTLEEGGADNEYLDPIREAVAFNDGYFRRLCETFATAGD